MRKLEVKLKPGRGGRRKRKEIWKRIEGFKNYYDISNYGRVRTRCIVRRPKIQSRYLVQMRPMRPRERSTGRLEILLVNPTTQERRCHQIRKLVADHFMKNRTPGAKLIPINKDRPNDCSIWNIKEMGVGTSGNKISKR